MKWISIRPYHTPDFNKLSFIQGKSFLSNKALWNFKTLKMKTEIENNEG